MDLTEVLNDLPEEKQSAILELHKQAVESERNQGISASRKKGEEVKKYMTEINRIRDIAKEHDITGDDLPKAISDALKIFKTQSVNQNEHSSKVSRMEKQLAEMQAENLSEKQKVNTLKLTEALNQAIGDNLHAKDFVIKNLIASGDVRVTENGSIVFVDDGDELDLQKGIESFKKKRPDLVKNNSIAGSGSSQNKYKNTDKTMSYDEFLKLDPVTRAKKMAEGYKFS